MITNNMVINDNKQYGKDLVVLKGQKLFMWDQAQRNLCSSSQNSNVKNTKLGDVSLS